MSKIAVVTLGCPKNLVDSDALLTAFGKEGFIRTTGIEEADFVLVNTCGFIKEAKQESIEEILKLTRSGKKGRKLIVFGCLAKRYGDRLMKEIPEIDGLWGVGEEEKIVEYCKTIQARGKRHEGGGTEKYMPLASSSYAYLKVAEGCSRGCTYCVIPSIRGPFRSMDPENVLRNAEALIRSGVRELVLVAQDLGSYGREFGGYPLSSLVRDISSLSGDFWLRLLYLNPLSVTDGLLSAIQDEKKVCKYVDIPLQHSEDRILRAMGRGGTQRSIIKTIQKTREAIPGVAIRTTFIVGFPGETQGDFEGLRNLIQEMRFEHLGVFTYSKEEGTSAAKMRGHVPGKTKERRRDEIMRMQSSISFEKNKSLVGETFRVLVDEVDGHVAVGRLSSQAPEIDGVVLIEMGQEARGNKQGAMGKKERGNASRFTHHASRTLRAGEFAEVKIVEAYDYDLKGRPIQ